MISENADNLPVASAKLAGLFAYNGQRKQSNRDSLLLAATELFCRKGYAAVSVEDITREAGVSRVTFYRHFPTKAAVALELFERAGDIAGPRLVEIGSREFRDRSVVVRWLDEIFDLNREMRGIVRVLSQASVVEANFSEQVRPYIFDIIAALGRTIPAFDADGQRPADEKRQVRGWLLLYTILDQSNHAANTQGVAASAAMIEVLADSFVDFVNSVQPAD